MKFINLNLISPLLKALEKEDISETTEIQKIAIPYGLGGQDILATAQTGSGKTLAFILPVLQNLYEKRGNVEGKIERKIKALILAPTRELVDQIGNTLKPLCMNTNLKHTVIFGGKSQFHQVKAINRGIDILVATPGRLVDLFEQGILHIKDVDMLVLDEADKMLDMGFLPTIEKIIKLISETKQTMFFSATMPEKVKKLADEILNRPKEIIITDNSVTSYNIKQNIFLVEKNNKKQLLRHIIKTEHYDSIVVFMKTQEDVENITKYLSYAKIKVDSIHGNKKQNIRIRALKRLQNREIEVLVATDVLARGLDIKDLSCVINYELPKDPETYIHRIGRTARAGNKGIAISFCTKKDQFLIDEIEDILGKKIKIKKPDITFTEESSQNNKKNRRGRTNSKGGKYRRR